MKIMKSDEVKEEGMKESPKRYTNPFLSDEENEKVNSWNSQDLYTDKKVMECDLPELLVCYKEGSFHVKDICVDEGIPQGEKFLFDEDKHDDIINAKEMTFLPLEDYNMESNGHIENLDQGIERNLQDLPEKDCKKEDIEFLDPNEIKKVSKDDEISECAPETLKPSKESDMVPEVDDSYVPEEEKINRLDDVSKEEIVSKNMPLLQQDQKPLPSLKFLLDSLHGVHDKDQQPCQSIINIEDTAKRPLEGNATKEEEVGTSLQTTINLNENMEEKSTLNLTNGKSVNTHQNPETIHEHGVGESSFSVTGPVSGLITYSGQIAFSGSVSLRSDSSTTSTRSFAFPILQTEWNSSPVRMAKADRRRLQKQRGWRNGLLCCRF